ncbi:MAG: 2'-5' RNA ligase family protein [Chitinophagaceae bacterium]
MMISNPSMPGYRINEYRLVVPLPEALQQKVLSVRQTLHQKYGVKPTFELKPSLTLLRCHAFEKGEPRLLEKLQQVALQTAPFKVELEDYAGYPTHTIYINVMTKSPFNDLCKELKKSKWLMQVPQHQPFFINEPHLMIAQRLKPKEFTNMWNECEQRQFTGRFIADAVLLLKRSEQNKAYQVVRRFEFLNLPLSIKQGTLFADF